MVDRRAVFRGYAADAGCYAISAALGALDQPLWALGGVSLYAALRAADRVY